MERSGTNKRMRQRAAVVGAGTAGLSSAVLLSRAGWKVTLFEACADPEPVGAGLLIQPTGAAVLDRLGVLPRLRAVGSRIDRLLGTDAGGRAVIDLNYAGLDGGVGIGLHRGELFDALWDAAALAGVELVSGARVTRVIDRSDDDLLELSTEPGDRFGPFELVVAADGRRSTLRPQVDPHSRDETYPWGAIWAVVPHTDRLFGETLRQVYRGTDTMLGVLPSGRDPDTRRSCASLFWSLPLDRFEAFRAEGLGAWRGRMIELLPELEPLLDHVADPSQLRFAEYGDVTVRTPVRGRLVLIGDAAHAMSPQLGQGANLALMDAAMLSSAVSSDIAVTQALQNYVRASRPYQRFYARVSRWLTPLFQSHRNRLAPWRDRAFRLACANRWVRREALLTMAGFKRGLLSHRPLALDDLKRQRGD